MACSNACKLCKNLAISDSVTIVTVGGIDTLLIDIPAATYANGQKVCIVVAQNIPVAATVTMPVAISIGGVTTTVYPLTTCDCRQVQASAIRTRTRYSTIVATTATGGVFRALGGLCCSPNNALATIPVVAP